MSVERQGADTNSSFSWARISGNNPEVGEILTRQLELLHSEPDIQRDITVEAGNVNFIFPYERLVGRHAQTEDGRTALVGEIQRRMSDTTKLYIKERVNPSRPSPHNPQIVVRNPDHHEISQIVSQALAKPDTTLYVQKRKTLSGNTVGLTVFNRTYVNQENLDTEVEYVTGIMTKDEDTIVAVRITKGI